MVKTTLKIDGMMCSMCEAHMNDLVRQNCSVKKVTSSAKNGETVVISEEPLDISMLDKEIKGIGYTLLSHESEPSRAIPVFPMRKRDCSTGSNGAKSSQ